MPLAAGRTEQGTTKRHKPEEIVAKLRQVDVLISQGRSVADAIRSIGVTEVADYRWREGGGGRAGPRGSGRGGRDPLDRRDGSDRLPLAAGVRRPEVGPSPSDEGLGDREPAAQEGHRRSDAGQADPAGGRPGKLLSPARRRACTEPVTDVPPACA